MRSVHEKLLGSNPLQDGIDKVAELYPNGVNSLALPPDNMFFIPQQQRISDTVEIDDTAICAVINAVRALGIDNHKIPFDIARRLWAANIRDQDLLSELLSVGNSTTYTPIFPKGIDHCFTIIKGTKGIDEIPIRIEAANDLSLVHQALASGFKAVYFDKQQQLPLAVIGMMQNEDYAFWEILLPHEDTLFTYARHPSGAFTVINQPQAVAIPIYPRSIEAHIETPMWLVGKDIDTLPGEFPGSQ